MRDRTIDGTNEQAILDIVLSYPGGRVCIDTSVTDAIAADPAVARIRCRVPGAAARYREQDKHRRYPGPGLCPAAVESGGRMGAELLAFLRAHAPGEGVERSEALADVKQRLVVAVARGNAAMLLGSAGPRPRPWPSPCQAEGAAWVRR